MEDFETRTAQWLLENPLEQPGWVVEDLIPCGLTLFAGDPKIGKSWLGLDLALHVASGEPFWGFATAKGTVLYLCLEDTFGRVQRRLQRLVDEANDNLCCVVSARRIGTGLIEQLDSFAGSHPDLRMVIVDTFQTVRTPSNQTIYSADYEDMGALKAFADEWKIAMLVVHHTRKMGDGDVFNTISGSNGLMGCADETMVLKLKARGSSGATLFITGRDVKDQEFSVRFANCRWELVEKVSDEELEERAVPEAVHAVVNFMLDGVADVWEGTATELLSLIDCGGVRANVLSKYLNEHSAYMRSKGVAFSKKMVRGVKVNHLERVSMVSQIRAYGFYRYHRHPGVGSAFVGRQKGGARGVRQAAYCVDTSAIPMVHLPESPAFHAAPFVLVMLGARIRFSKYPIGGTHFRSNGFSWIRAARRMRIHGLVDRACISI